jgi:hypothetical protein
MFVTACADEEGYVPRTIYGYGNGKDTPSSGSNGNNGSPSNKGNNNNGGSATNNPTTSGDDNSNDPSQSQPSPPTPTPTTTPADGGATPDASTSTTPTTPTTPTTTPPAGSCLNPSCAADGNGLCGCQATDGNGNLVFMGCQDGACECTDDQGNDTNDFNATCDDVASAQLAFQQCACAN